MRRRNLPARGTDEQEQACAVQIGPKLHCASSLSLQIAQVQVSTELLEVSGMDSKDSSPKTVLPFVCLRNLPAVASQQQGPAAWGYCCDGLSDNLYFFKLNVFTFPKELLK